MVLTKDELIEALKNEVRILLHLASKVEAAMLDYRPTPKQRTLLELLQYLSIFAPIHLRTIRGAQFDMEAWRQAWTTEKARAKTLTLPQTIEAIGKHPALFDDLLGSCSDAGFRGEMEMFGSRASRGSLFVSMVLGHYTAYRMQLFLYLKCCGRDELNTMNLWAGMDGRV